MCGRYGLFRDPSSLVHALGGALPAKWRFAPHYNVAPQQPVLGLRNTPGRELEEFRWGLAVGDVAGSARLATINARIETVATSPLYGPLLPVRRCVLFADGYYEWHLRPDGVKQPTWIERRDGAGFVFAGLWSDRDEDGAPMLTCTIVTQPASPELAMLHERMPAVLDAASAERWLAPERLAPDDAVALLRPASGSEWRHHPVGTAVGNVRNDSPELVVETEPLSIQASLFDAAGA